ncbi:MAG: transporter [Phycisphaerales bacterium]|jgi:L-fucose mutarotase|nr:transporter [Phycisphaerales bacterium]
MLKHQLLHPQITAALARGGHTSKVLISDGNFPHGSRRGPNAEVVYLNLRAGLPTVTDVLEVLTTAIPIERADVMDYARTGPYALSADPEIWADFRRLLQSTDCRGELTKIERFAFYDAASTHDVMLTIATGEQRIYANLLLTIGVVR